MAVYAPREMKTSSLSDLIVDRLLEQIRRSGLTAGQMIPSERKIMKEYGVSRMACREALAKLQGLGVLTAHHGKGVYVAQIDSMTVNPAVLKILQAHGEISNEDVLQVRLLIEPAAAALAARNATEEARSEILQLATEASSVLEGLSGLERVESFAAIDVEFHQKVATAGGNKVLPLLFRSTHELLLRVRLEVLIKQPDITSRALKDHLRIAEVIGDRREEDARKAMERHIRLRGQELLADIPEITETHE